MTRQGRFWRVLIIMIFGLVLVTLGLILTDRAQIPASAQAQELFTLYFELDHARQDSARIFAELYHVEGHPERVNAPEAIGSKPSLTSREELLSRLNEDRAFVERTLDAIDQKRFTDIEVDTRYDKVRDFYTSLFDFEDMVLNEFSLAETNPEWRMHLATILFEGLEWPALLAKDAGLIDSLASLARQHELEFDPAPYEDVFRARLVELDTPFVSDEVNTIVYPFTVNGTANYYVLLNVAFENPLSEKMDVRLEDPNGRIFTPDHFAVSTDTDNSAELNQRSYIYRSEHVIIIKVFPEDPTIPLTPGAWKLYVTAPIGSQMVIGMVEL